MSRASNGRGTIFKSADGRRWEGCVSYGVDPFTKKRIRKHVRGRTKSEVQAKVDALIEQGPDAPHVTTRSLDSRLTLSQWLEIWVSERTTVVRPNTVSGYRTDLLYVARSGVGALRLKTIRPADIKCLNTWVTDQGRSPGTVNHLRRTLNAAFNAAKASHLIANNPIDDIKKAEPDAHILVPYNFEEIAKLVAAARARRNGVRWQIALLGLRQGEVLGLRWIDVDFDQAHLLVRGSLTWLPWSHGCHLRANPTPCGKTARWCPDRHGGGPRIAKTKTHASVRVVGLPEAVLEELRAHREAQQAEREEAGDSWQPLDFVFATRHGAPIDRTSDREDWLDLVATAHVRQLRVHDLRHTAATVLLMLGDDTRNLLEIMGWSSMSLVGRYAHVVPEVRRKVADRQQVLFATDAPVDGSTDSKPVAVSDAASGDLIKAAKAAKAAKAGTTGKVGKTGKGGKTASHQRRASTGGATHSPSVLARARRALRHQP